MSHRIRTAAMSVVGAVFALSCNDQGPTAPIEVPPLAAISDGAHESGNGNFFFLPPLVRHPRHHPSFDPGAFDPTLEPEVEICVLDGTACGRTLVRFPFIRDSRASRPPDGHHQDDDDDDDEDDDQDDDDDDEDDDRGRPEGVRLRRHLQHYRTNWHTGRYQLDSRATYRIRVLLGATELGFADVRVVKSGSELKHVDQQRFIAVKRGRTLPIKFRIERGSASPPAPKPDLMIGSLVVPPLAAVGGTLVVAAQVVNAGSGDAAGTDARLRVSSADGEIASATVPQDALAAGSQVTLSASFTVDPSWPAEVVVEVATDAGGTVDEADEGNNTAISDPVRIEFLDLQVTSVQFSARTVVLRCAVDLEAVVRNNGNTDAPETDAQFTLRDGSGTEVASQLLPQPPIAAGASVTIRQSFIAGPGWPGELIGQVATDASGGVNESHEDNNASHTEISVQARVSPPAGFDKLWVCGNNTSWPDPNNWEPAGTPASTHNVYVPAGTPSYPVLTAAVTVGDLTIAEEARVALSTFNLTATGNVVSGLITGGGSLIMNGTGKTLRGIVPSFTAAGAISLSGDAIASQVTVNPDRSLDLKGFGLTVAGDFTVRFTASGSSHLLMTTGADRLEVGGDLLVQSESRLEAGTVILRGDFEAPNRNVAVTGTRFIFDGSAPQSASVHNATGSYFADVEIRTPHGVNFASDIRVTGQLVLVPGALLTQTNAGHSTFYTARFPEVQSPDGYRIATTVIDGAITLDRDAILAWPSADVIINPGRSLDLAGHSLEVAGDFSVAFIATGTPHLLMTTGSDRLVVGGNMLVRSESRLEAGTVILRGDFGAPSRDVAVTGTRFVFDGSALQSVSVHDAVGSYFADVEVRTPHGVNFASDIRVTGQLVLAPGALLTQTNVGNSTFYTTRFPAVQAPDGYQITTTVIDGAVTLDRDVTLAWPSAGVRVNGGRSLDLAGFTLIIPGDFRVAFSAAGTRHLLMTTGPDRLEVGGVLTIQSETQLDAGTIVLRGNFVQSNRSGAVAPSATRFVFSGSAPQTVSFSNAVSSFFAGVEIQPGAAVSLLSNAQIKGNLDLNGALTVPSPRVLTVVGTLFFRGSLTNNGTVNVGQCSNQSGAFSGTGNNPCP